jgi:hypothetical protein
MRIKQGKGDIFIMNSIIIREALAEDAEQLIEYMKTVGVRGRSAGVSDQGFLV